MSSENTAGVLEQAAWNVPFSQMGVVIERMSTVISFVGLAGEPATEKYGARINRLIEYLDKGSTMLAGLAVDLQASADSVATGGPI
jgi:hypothetical protein